MYNAAEKLGEVRPSIIDGRVQKIGQLYVGQTFSIEAQHENGNFMSDIFASTQVETRGIDPVLSFLFH